MNSEIKTEIKRIVMKNKKMTEYFSNLGCCPNTLVNKVLEETVQKYPEKLALVDPSNKDALVGLKPDRYTYNQFDEAINRLASGFFDLGIRKDDIVIIQLPNITEHIIVSYALWKIGAIASPVIVQFRTHELSYIIELTKAKAFVTLSEFHGFDHLEMAKKLRSDFRELQHVISLPEIRTMMSSGKIEEDLSRGIEIDPDDIIQINWTSGTEANPKGCPHSHNHFIGLGELCGLAAQMSAKDVILCPFPLQYISSTAVFMFPAFQLGATYVLHHPFDLNVFLQQMQEEKATYAGGSPAMHLMLLNHPDIDKYDLGSLRLMMTGSAPTPDYIVKTYKEKYGVEMVNFWGQNELAGLPSGPIDVPDPYRRALTFPQFGKRGVKWNTRNSECIETMILDSSDKELNSVGDVGELVYKSAFCLPCYFRNPEMDEKSRVGDFFRTGDYFRIEEDNLLTFYGRKKDIIIRGGQNVSPEEIENILQYHPKISEVAVVGYPDPRLGEKACAYVVPRPGEAISLDEIVSFMKEKDVAIFKLPERLEISEGLPRNPAGKVQKKILRDDIERKIGGEDK